MNAVPASHELEPTRDPSAYARRPRFGGVFWVMMAFSLLCLLAAAAVVILGPRLMPLRRAAGTPTATAAAAPPPAAPTPIAQDLQPNAPDLMTRVQRLEVGQTRMENAAAGALAAASLSAAAAKPAPFPADLAAAARLLPTSPDILALAPLAQEGAPTRAALAADLDDLGAQIATAARAPGRNASFMDRALYAFSRVVTVRRIDANATGVDAVLARAERAADDGNLERAVALLDTLPDPTKAVLAPWRDKAERRIEIDQHIAALRGEAMADLTAAQGGGQGATGGPGAMGGQEAAQ
ncbi:MAG: COG4223 family protein [Caulobacteraceae bacterium]